MLTLLFTLVACELIDTADTAAGGLADEPDVYEQFCARADECNLLEGMSERECVEDYREAVQDCTGTEEADWETDQADCLAEHDDCDDWAACLADTYTWGCWDG